MHTQVYVVRHNGLSKDKCSMLTRTLKNISGGSALVLAVRTGEGWEVAEAQSIAPFVL